MEMANYIYSILRSQPMIMFSWGFNNPLALANEEGLVFSVNGFKHKGNVKIVYHSGKDLFVCAGGAVYKLGYFFAWCGRLVAVGVVFDFVEARENDAKLFGRYVF